MSQFKATISRADYLTAWALFTLAHSRYVEAALFGEELNKVIMSEPERYPGGFVDDLIYSDERATQAEFDAALKSEGITVELSASTDE